MDNPVLIASHFTAGAKAMNGVPFFLAQSSGEGRHGFVEKRICITLRMPSTTGVVSLNRVLHKFEADGHQKVAVPPTSTHAQTVRQPPFIEPVGESRPLKITNPANRHPAGSQKRLDRPVSPLSGTRY